VDVTIVGGDLGDDRCNHIVRSISFDNDGIVGVEMHQDGCLGKGCLEGLKCLGVVRAPGEWGVLSHEVNQGDDDVRESYNELAIEVGEPQKCLDCFEVGWGWPDTDHVSFGHVHGDASGGDHKAQELNLLHVEQAIFGFGVQVILTKMLQDMSDMNLMIF